MAKRKRKTNGIAGNRILIIVVSIIIVLATFIWIAYRANQKKTAAHFALYPGYGIELPLGYSIHGIDVSSYQGKIYWPAIANMQDRNVRISFVFIKATEGLRQVDRQYQRNWQQSKQAQITRGAYHYFIATKSGSLQAQNFLKTVQLQPGDLPPVLDVEELYGVRPDSMRSRVAAWLTAVEQVYQVKPIIYTSAKFYKDYLGRQFDKYPLWVAHYFVKEKPAVDDGWYFWQHNAAGKINGILTKVDFNVFSGNSTQFSKLLIR
ncbi:MAG: glycoside hydrolase family 25 protein [Bacteroidetes bacterium]|nr:glycoside hydrolase family 25 protein [Bacteroidota bacterium]